MTMLFSLKVSTTSHRMLLAFTAVTAALVAGTGCGGSELETGYKPRPLTATDAQRKAYYAPQYSREAAMAAQQQHQQGNEVGTAGRHRAGAPY